MASSDKLLPKLSHLFANQMRQLASEVADILVGWLIGDCILK